MEVKYVAFSGYAVAAPLTRFRPGSHSVKRGVRKKVKKGLISPGGSRMSRGSWGDATGSANMLSGFLGKSKRQTSQGPVIDPVDALRNSA